MMQGESLEARPTMVLRCMRHHRMTLPEPSSPATRQLFLPRSIQTYLVLQARRGSMMIDPNFENAGLVIVEAHDFVLAIAVTV